MSTAVLSSTAIHHGYLSLSAYSQRTNSRPVYGRNSQSPSQKNLMTEKLYMRLLRDCRKKEGNPEFGLLNLLLGQKVGCDFMFFLFMKFMWFEQSAVYIFGWLLWRDKLNNAESGIFSSSEPKAYWWAYSISYSLSSVCGYICVLSTFSNIFLSKTTGPIEAKFHVKPSWDGGSMVQVTWPIWPPCPYMVKTFSGTKRLMTLKLGMQHWALKC